MQLVCHLRADKTNHDLILGLVPKNLPLTIPLRAASTLPLGRFDSGCTSLLVWLGKIFGASLRAALAGYIFYFYARALCGADSNTFNVRTLNA